MRTIKNDLERKELFDAYLLRRHRLTKLPEEADMLADSQPKEKKQRKEYVGLMAETISSIDGAGIAYHTYSDIGKYTVFNTE